MSIIISKGTSIKAEVASVLTAVAQVVSFSGPGSDPETFEADYLDNTDPGIPHKPTGRVEGGSLEFEIWLDPSLAGHKSLAAKSAAPAVETYSLTFSDATVWPFNGIFKGPNPTGALADGIKASCSVKLDGMVTYPA
jgi:hypothetical protein